MNSEFISIDRLEEHEKLIRENGYLRDKINELEEQHEKHMKNTIKNNHIIFDLREQHDKVQKEVYDLLECALEQDKENVNLIDRLKLILDILEEEY